MMCRTALRAAPGSPIRRATSGRLLVALVVLAATGLSACGATDIPSPATTVTVYADETTPPPTSSEPTPVPTVTAAPTPVPSIPASIAAGIGRGAPANYAEADRRIAKAKATADIGSFTSPTGNIYCSITGSSAACEVREGRIASPIPDLCPAGGATDIGRIELGAATATPVCNSDTIRDTSAPKLAYRSRTTVAGSPFTCLSESVGITCLNATSQHGFFLARGSFVTF